MVSFGQAIQIPAPQVIQWLNITFLTFGHHSRGHLRDDWRQVSVTSMVFRKKKIPCAPRLCHTHFVLRKLVLFKNLLSLATVCISLSSLVLIFKNINYHLLLVHSNDNINLSRLDLLVKGFPLRQPQRYSQTLQNWFFFILAIRKG